MSNELEHVNLETMERVLKQIDYWTSRIEFHSQWMACWQANLDSGLADGKAITPEQREQFIESVEWECKMIRNAQQSRHNMAKLIGIGDRFPPPSQA